MGDGLELYEECRKDIKKDIQRQIKCNPSFKVARFVDEPVLRKTVLSQYGRFYNGMKKAGVADNVENIRGKYVQAVDTAGRLRPSEVPPELSIEKEYYDRYGKGFNSVNPDPMHQAYVCPRCGLKQMMDLAVMGNECPRCRHLTPIGRLVKDGYHSKW